MRLTFVVAGWAAFLLGALFVASVLHPETASAQVAPSGVECNNSGGSGGLSPGEYDVTIAGRDVLLIVGTGYDSSHPSILTFYLHGDGAADRTFLTNDKRELVGDNGWIYVAPRAINDSWASGGVGSTATSNATIESNAQLLGDVFDAVFADYNVCRNVLLGSSASGGSWFYDGYFLSTRGDQYPAYMNIACGSSGIDSSWSGFHFVDDLLSFTTDPAIQARTKLHYSIGTADFLYPRAQQAIPYLRSLGFDVTTDIRPGVSHCAFDLDQASANWWTDLCEDGFIPVTSRDAAGAPRPESCNAGQVAGTRCGGRLITIDMNSNGGVGDGTGGADVILGTPGDDVIRGLGGDDVICGEGGRDRIYGGPGDDTIIGGFGIDYLWGGDGEDTMDGGGGSDRMYGGADDDLILGDSGADRMWGGPGNDEMRGMGGQDFMWGEAGNDLMQGNFQTDNMWGGPGNDTMFGAGGKDSLFGEGGSDALSGGNNTDYLDGGDGVDTANGGRGRDKPLVAPEVRASNGQLFDGSGCIAETIVNCQPT